MGLQAKGAAIAFESVGFLRGIESTAIADVLTCKS
jgi:hypothetical protein